MSIIGNGDWKWPPARTIQLMELQSSMPGTLKPSMTDDNVAWSLSRDGIYSIRSIWNEWRVHKPKVKWASLIWFQAHIPRVSMIVWMTI